MSNSFPTGGFGARMDPDAMWQAFEQLRSTFEKKVGTRMGRGDVRAAVLSLLSEKPMHGYQIVGLDYDYAYDYSTFTTADGWGVTVYNCS